MHIEIPDGVLPPWLWITGLILVVGLLVAAIYFAKKQEEKMPLAALFAALSLIVMSVPLGLPAHINLMVLVGIIVGPWWALIVSFIVNSLLSSIGHGGVTVIGLNTLLLWSQALFGFYLFGLAKSIISEKGSALKGVVGGVVTFLSLMASFLLLGGMVFAINLNPEEVLIHDHSHDHGHYHHEEDHGHEEDHHGDHEYESDGHEESHYKEDEEDHGHEEVHHGDHGDGHEEDNDQEYENDEDGHHHEEYHGNDHHEGDVEDHDHENDHGHSHSHDPEDYYDDEISLKRFFAIALPIFLYAAIIESIVVGMAISFISKGKPDLL